MPSAAREGTKAGAWWSSLAAEAPPTGGSGGEEVEAANAEGELHDDSQRLIHVPGASQEAMKAPSKTVWAAEPARAAALAAEVPTGTKRAHGSHDEESHGSLRSPVAARQGRTAEGRAAAPPEGGGSASLVGATNATKPLEIARRRRAAKRAGLRAWAIAREMGAHAWTEPVAHTYG